MKKKILIILGIGIIILILLQVFKKETKTISVPSFTTSLIDNRSTLIQLSGDVSRYTEDVINEGLTHSYSEKTIAIDHFKKVIGDFSIINDSEYSIQYELNDSQYLSISKQDLKAISYTAKVGSGFVHDCSSNTIPSIMINLTRSVDNSANFSSLQIPTPHGCTINIFQIIGDDIITDPAGSPFGSIYVESGYVKGFDLNNTIIGFIDKGIKIPTKSFQKSWFEVINSRVKLYSVKSIMIDDCSNSKLSCYVSMSGSYDESKPSTNNLSKVNKVYILDEKQKLAIPGYMLIFDGVIHPYNKTEYADLKIQVQAIYPAIDLSYFKD